MAIDIEIIKRAWEIRKKGVNSLKDIANQFGVDEKELLKGIEEIANQENKA